MYYVLCTMYYEYVYLLILIPFGKYLELNTTKHIAFPL